MAEEQIEKNEIYVEGSCNVILDTAKSVYDEEIDRFKQAEAKTNITLAFVGILFGAYLTYLGTYKPPIEETSYLIYTVLFKIAVFICYIVSIIYFLKAISTGKYEQVDLNQFATESFALKNTEIATLTVAFTYRDVVNLNRGVLEKKLECYSKGLRILTYGFVIFTIHFLIEEVIRHV